MIRSTFYGFTTAQLALTASQKSLDVVGQNIANVNTTGYTRQRLDVYSASSGGINDRYSSKYSNVGQGVVIGGVTQIRNQFLDVRFRNEACKVGEYDTKLSVLTDLENIFDEISVDGLDSQISDLVSQLNSLVSNVGNSEFDGIVRSSASTLVKLFNQYSTQVDTISDQEIYNFADVNIPDVNNILKNISELNTSIKNDQIHGNNSLELLDERNLLIDELSHYVKIDVKYTSNEIATGVVVEDVNITLSDTGTSIINNSDYSEFSYDETTGKLMVGSSSETMDKATDSINGLLTKLGNLNNTISTTSDPDVKSAALDSQSKLIEQLKEYLPDISVTTGDAKDITIDVGGSTINLLNGTTAASLTYDEINKTISSGSDDITSKIVTATGNAAPDDSITDKISSGAFKASLDMLNSAGEYDTPPSTIRGIQYYSKVLDTIALKLATEFNTANSYTDEEAALLGITEYQDRPLFESTDGGPITAANIKIAENWSNGTYGITSTKTVAENSGEDDTSGASDNITKIISIFDTDYTFKTADDGVQIFNGTIQECFTQTISILNLDVESTTSILDNYSTVYDGIQDSRDSVSAVSLDEEGIDLIQYQKSYNAAARLMTTLDEALETLMNMGVVGR